MAKKRKGKKKKSKKKHPSVSYYPNGHVVIRDKKGRFVRWMHRVKKKPKKKSKRKGKRRR